MTWVATLFAAAAYVILGRAIVSSRMRGSHTAFALLNIAAVYCFCFWEKDRRFTLIFAAYLALVSGQYLTLRWWSERPGWRPWLAFFTPITLLLVVRYTPAGFLASAIPAFREALERNENLSLAPHFVGLSYLAFRTSHLILEIRNGGVRRPGFWEYLGFAFFAPTISVGPISPFSQHQRAFSETNRPAIPVGRALLRVLVGAVKYRFFGPLLNQLTYAGLLLDGHPHHWIDLPIAAVAFYLYLFCNFSGFCDIAIGGAGLMGITVAENFDRPFSARNIKEFWSRWHITLSHYMRDVVFSPLSKALVRAFGPARTNHALACAIMAVFTLIGLWHGTGWNFLALGLIHGIGVVANHYYSVALKSCLAKDRFLAYQRHPIIKSAAVVITFGYVAMSLFFLANDLESMRSIFAMLRGQATP